MDEIAFRRANISRILQEDFGGNRSEMARALKKQPNFVSELVSGARKSFGEKLARQIEKKLHKPHGSLDLPPVGSPIVAEPLATYAAHRWPFSFDVGRFLALTLAQRAHVEKVLISLIEGFEGIPRPKRAKGAAARR